MKNIYSLLGLLFFIISCNREEKTNISEVKENSSKLIPTKQSVINTTPGDPSFVVSKDTISKFGPNNITRNALQDQNGKIWLASWQGIISYDGKLFTNVTLKEGLRHFHVFSILEERDGDLWFGTIGGGAYHYDGRFFTLLTTKDGLAGDAVMCMMEDKSGNIWFGTNNGASCYDGKTFTNITEKEGMINNFVSSIVQDNTGKIWFGTRGGVCSFYEASTLSGGSRSFTKCEKKEGSPFGNAQGMIKDKAGNIWFGNQDGLFRYDGKTSVNISKNGAGNILEDKTGNLWLSANTANDHGWVLYKYNGKSFEEIIVKNNSKNPFNNQIFGTIEDKNGNIWICTTNGVSRYDPSERTFTNFNEKEEPKLNTN